MNRPVLTTPEAQEARFFHVARNLKQFQKYNSVIGSNVALTSMTSQQRKEKNDHLGYDLAQLAAQSQVLIFETDEKQLMSAAACN